MMRRALAGFFLVVVGVLGSALSERSALAQSANGPYANMPSTAPIGVRIPKYLDVPEGSKGPAIDPAKGYRTEKLGNGLYMVTDGAYQNMFLVYDRGVVMVDAPPGYAAKLLQAVAEVTKNPITHVIYTHSHVDHIAGVKSLGGTPIIIAQEETKRLLKRAADPNRPLPTVTFKDKYSLHVGDQSLELSYHGDGHEPGNIFVYAPAQKVLMVVDVVFPGWMPFRRWAVAHDVPGVFAQVEEIRKMDWQTFVGGHVSRTGTHADVDLQAEFMQDVKAAASKALASTKPGQGMDAKDVASNPWAVFDDYIDRVVIQCVDEVTPKWQHKLAAYDAFVWDQCYAMEQSLRID